MSVTVRSCESYNYKHDYRNVFLSNIFFITCLGASSTQHKISGLRLLKHTNVGLIKTCQLLLAKSVCKLSPKVCCSRNVYRNTRLNQAILHWSLAR